MITINRKAISIGILLWVVMFFLGTATMMTAGKEAIGKVLLIFGPILSGIGAWWYLKPAPGITQGLRVGLLWTVIAIVLDTIVIVYMFKNGWNYFSGWTVWAGYFEIILIPTIVGKLLKK